MQEVELIADNKPSQTFTIDKNPERCKPLIITATMENNKLQATTQFMNHLGSDCGLRQEAKITALVFATIPTAAGLATENAAKRNNKKFLTADALLKVSHTPNNKRNEAFNKMLEG